MTDAPMHLPDSADSLSFWDSHSCKYPTLASLALKYLTSPASSAPVERIFSIAGKVFRPDRCRIKSQNFERLMFIKSYDFSS